MTPRPDRLLVVAGLVLLAACTTTDARASVGPLRIAPVVARRVAAPDPWSLLDPGLLATPARTVAALAPQGPGARFKPQPSLGATHLMVGQQQLDEDYWRPASIHRSVGLETSFERLDDWIGGEGGFALVLDDDEGVFADPEMGNTKIDVDLVLVELYGGVHRTFFRESRLRPYVGAGASVFYVEADQIIKPTQGKRISDKEDEFAFGLYAHGGISFQVSRNFQLGLDYRVVGLTEVDVLSGPSGDVDYQQLAFFIGYGG